SLLRIDGRYQQQEVKQVAVLSEAFIDIPYAVVQLRGTQHLEVCRAIRGFHAHKLKETLPQRPAEAFAQRTEEQRVRCTGLLVDIYRRNGQPDDDDFAFTRLLCFEKLAVVWRCRQLLAFCQVNIDARQ